MGSVKRAREGINDKFALVRISFKQFMRDFDSLVGCVGDGSFPERLLAADWELDDFRPRMARSAIDPKAPFDASAEPTHWIFVELEDFNRIIVASCADVLPVRSPSADGQAVAAPREALSGQTEDRHVRMPELERRTGMSRSTIYRRIDAGRFPKSIPLAGNIAFWWESDVAEWLANPR